MKACRNGLIQHLERLLFYSADLNARNASGNTPLHVCAVNNQESCARTLLFRGAEKEALNFAGQTPYQVAVIAGNLDLAEIIKAHKSEDVGEFLIRSAKNILRLEREMKKITFCHFCISINSSLQRSSEIQPPSTHFHRKLPLPECLRRSLLNHGLRITDQWPRRSRCGFAAGASPWLRIWCLPQQSFVQCTSESPISVSFRSKFATIQLRIKV